MPVNQPEVPRRPVTTGRRSVLAAIVCAILGAVARAAAGAQEAVQARTMKVEGEPLHSRMSQGEPPVEPLDTMVHFRRSDTSTGKAMTHEVLSLTHEEKGDQSFPWTIYAHLDTHHTVGDACVLCSRLHKYGPGWSSGLHSEVFNHSRAVALGVNVEMGNDYEGAEPTQIIGVNVQAVGPKDADHGIQVHDGKARFRTGIHLKGSGDTGIDIEGGYHTGIHTHGHEIRLGDGGSIALDDAGEIRIRFRDGAIEFLKGDHRIAHIPVDGADHRI